jgi:hypothetical protein
LGDAVESASYNKLSIFFYDKYFFCLPQVKKVKKVFSTFPDEGDYPVPHKSQTKLMQGVINGSCTSVMKPVCRKQPKNSG